MGEIFQAVAALSALTFVVTSMLAMGLSLTMQEIITPLRNLRLVILALLASFVIVPLIAYGILLVVPLEQSLRTGLILLATAAGAPFLPKLVQVAKGSTAFGVGLMTLLMVVTIAYMPIVLPFLLPGVQINPWDIARSLILLMLVPLGIALFIRAYAPETAAIYQPVMSKVSTVALLLLMVTGLTLSVGNILGLIGTGGFLALLLFVVAAFLVGFLLGGRDPQIRNVMALGTAQRNVSAAIVVGATNFANDANVMAMILVGALLLLIVLMGAARQLGARAMATRPASATVEPASTSSAGASVEPAAGA
jgi:predicted Na+-dependent transporter